MNRGLLVGSDDEAGRVQLRAEEDARKAELPDLQRRGRRKRGYGASMKACIAARRSSGSSIDLR